jgi:cytochrome c-type biogenesis protein CcmH
MIGWLVFLALALVALLVAWWVGRLDRAALMLVGAALFVAAAGYAWQGSPGLAGAPHNVRKQSGLKQDTLFATERMRLLSPYGEAGQWLTFADGLNRAGEDQAAVTALKGAIVKLPRDVGLRLGYAHALLVLADYNLTPAVQLAYSRAEAIDPNDPAPLYFEGLARFEANDPDGAEQSWRALAAQLPAASPWRKVLADRLALFDQMHAGAAGAMPAAGG